MSVIAEVARDYFILRGLQDQLALTERNADNQLQLAEAHPHASGGGQGQRTGYLARRSAVANDLASIPTLQASIATTTYRLSVLTGRQPTALGERAGAAGIADASLARL